MNKLDDHLGTVYAGALAAIARADGELSVDETLRLESTLATRTTATLDHEALFFDPVTPAALARAVHGDGPHRGSGVDPREVALLLLADTFAVAGGDTALSPQEGRTALRFVAALGLTADDVRAAAPTLAEWTDALG